MKGKILLAAALLAAVAFFAGAPELRGEGRNVTYWGWLVDQLCASSPDGRAADGTDLIDEPYLHTRRCALRPPSMASGYGIFVEKVGGGYKYYRFDRNGNKLALELLKKTSKQDRIKVKVNGILRDDVLIKVKTLSEM